jgi:hypothetical protein
MGGINSGVIAHSMLNETMTLQDDHLMIIYDTEFESKDLLDLSKKLRDQIQPVFSDNTEHMRDI